MKINKCISLFLIIIGFSVFTGYSQTTNYSLKVNPNHVISTYDKAMLLGTNIGIYYEESHLMNFMMLQRLHDLNPGIIRMPGGSWSNELYWNGNKVRLSEESYIDSKSWENTIKEGGNPITVGFDTNRYKNERWEVDYSGYAPGFRINDNEHHLSDYHGFTDVLFLHKFIRSFGAETMVTVNMGTGTVEMAVEWVKWVKQRKNYAREPFDVKYWEMGNELDGNWEVGYYLPDGSEMNAKEYIRRYKLFAKAMKQADPDIKVGGSVASSMQLVFIEALIKDTDAPIDFISFHTYPSHNDEHDFVKMINEGAKINDAVAQIKTWLKTYRPQEKDHIEIALTEWNIKVREDITTVDILNTLWSAAMLGEIAKAGIDIAIQWDLFSTTNTGGHGLFNPKDPDMAARSQYWAIYLWSRYMGNNMLETKLNVPDFVRAYTTLDNDTISVMMINGSENKDVSITLDLADIETTGKATEVSFSKQQFVLNTQTLLPTVSKKPTLKEISVSKNQTIHLPSNSIKIIRFYP